MTPRVEAIQKRNRRRVGRDAGTETTVGSERDGRENVETQQWTTVGGREDAGGEDAGGEGWRDADGDGGGEAARRDDERRVEEEEGESE